MIEIDRGPADVLQQIAFSGGAPWVQAPQPRHMHEVLVRQAPAMAPRDELCYTFAAASVSAPSQPLFVTRVSPVAQLVPTPSRSAPFVAAPGALPVAALSLLGGGVLGGPQPAAVSKERVVVWFRADLRLHDHPALNHALEEGCVVPVFVFDTRAFGKTPAGFEKTGRYRAKFLIESVSALRKSLRERGSELVVRIGKPEEVLLDVCRKVGAKRCMYHREISHEEKQVERALEAAFEKVGVEASAFWAGTLYHLDDLPFHIDDMPDLYVQYREAVQLRGVIRDPLPAPASMPRLPKIDLGTVPTLRDLGLTEPNPDLCGIYTFSGGEAEALARLDLYIEESRRVPDGRSAALHLGTEFSCRISPWLALGCVSPRRIYADLVGRGSKAGQSTTYFELVWRDFFRLVSLRFARASRATTNTEPSSRRGLPSRVSAMAV